MKRGADGAISLDVSQIRVRGKPRRALVWRGWSWDKGGLLQCYEASLKGYVFKMIGDVIPGFPWRSWWWIIAGWSGRYHTCCIWYGDITLPLLCRLASLGEIKSNIIKQYLPHTHTHDNIYIYIFIYMRVYIMPLILAISSTWTLTWTVNTPNWIARYYSIYWNFKTIIFCVDVQLHRYVRCDSHGVLVITVERVEKCWGFILRRGCDCWQIGDLEKCLANWHSKTGPFQGHVTVIGFPRAWPFGSMGSVHS